ncbi:hypothetical protein O1611_g8367 [Lasiodiplodia mahajangana]|uniref:Uncharacterized protein n=1 Tax=Lasiodiplodia mahajangana TaxID=1108764 RepID=A0ACC2JCN5_9PEZI|nr:hypothetical protein O1611_g8367 [Lasiodiplodia mahajangana]
MSVFPPGAASEADYFLGRDDAIARTVMAEVPVTLTYQPKKTDKQQTPQQAIDEFWAKFTTKAPGKGWLDAMLRCV